MFGLSIGKEHGFLVGGKSLENYPQQQATIQLVHQQPYEIRTGGQAYIQRLELEGLDISNIDTFGMHPAQVTFVPPQTISVTTFEERCYSCRSLNGKTFDSTSIEKGPLRGRVRFRT